MRPSPSSDLRGAADLAVQAVQAVTTIVEDMHQSIAAPLPGRIMRQRVYESIRRVTGGVGKAIDFGLVQVLPQIVNQPPGPRRDAFIAALNGVLGDHLAATNNPLAVPMSLRMGPHDLPIADADALAQAVPDADGRLLILVHGSSMSDRQWMWHDHDHGAALAAAHGWTPVYLRYNSGLHVSTNGAAFAAQLDQLVAHWPAPIDEIAIVAYSMGGLVVRSALHQAVDPPAIARIVFLGTPHHGAPLERAGNWIDTMIGLHPYSAPIGRLARIRSAGITDLRYGNLLDEDWQARDRFALERDRRTPVALPANATCFAIAGQLRSGRLGALAGDGLVPVQSALGEHADPQHCLQIPAAQQLVVPNAGHLDLLSSQTVYAAMKKWLGD